MDEPTATRPTFCPQCGNKIEAADRFCRSCGLDLGALPAPVVPQGGPQEQAPSVWADQPTWETVPHPFASPAAAAGFGATSTPHSMTVQPPPVVAPRQNLVPLIAGSVVVAVIAIGAYYLFSQGTIGGHEVAGTFEMTGSTGGFSDSISLTGTTCEGDGSYGDIGPGTPVTVKNEKGEILDSGVLGLGSGTKFLCTFTFTLKVPDTAKFYTFEVGRRGDLSYDRAELESRGWEVGFNLGS